tara:strand:- start:164 stop:319 length:156 start_codon:yes stop_codon:yes gene_type:complete
MRLPPDAAADAPMYFQKAIQEAGSEWGTHKKMINTREKGSTCDVFRSGGFH